MAPTFSLINENGQAVTQGSYAGSFQLVFFGYTFCLDKSPTTLAFIRVSLNSLGEQTDQIQPLFITVLETQILLDIAFLAFY